MTDVNADEHLVESQENTPQSQRKTVRFSMEEDDMDDEIHPEDKPKLRRLSWSEKTARRFKNMTMNECTTLGVIILVNFINICLVVAKGWAAADAGSFSIGNSAIESGGDVVVGAIVLLAMVHKKFMTATEDYPRGVSSDSVSTLAASLMMMTMAVINTSVNIDRFFTKQHHPEIEIEHTGIVVLNVVLKIILLIICHLKRNVQQIRVLRQDQFVDIFTNLIAVLFTLGCTISPISDLIGALVIFIFIMGNWGPQFYKHCTRLYGKKASTKIYEEIEQAIKETKLTQSFVITAFHCGERIFVEVDVALSDPTNTSAIKIIEQQILEVESVSVALVRDVSISETGPPVLILPDYCSDNESVCNDSNERLCPLTPHNSRDSIV